ncbi:MAG: hypothetical protein HY579_12760 [Nitrospinae bacterium]|nr:hypothetical protein [Nitrospinota bacterium]
MPNPSKISETPGFRLQGTDGIRREVKPASAPELAGLSPREAFLERGFITEEFMELYAYAYSRQLAAGRASARGQRRGNADAAAEESASAQAGGGVSSKPGLVVVGWDPRDTRGVFNSAVVRGARKAGMNVLRLGVVPTPLVPLYMTHKNARAGFMVTASHNPRDQNGIKIFHSYRGMKLLPQNDVELTRAVLALDYRSLKDLPETGEVVDCRDDALDLFARFSLDPANSWLPPGATPPRADAEAGCGSPLQRGPGGFAFRRSLRVIVASPPFDKGGVGGFARGVTLIVDPANGSLSGIAADIFRRAGFEEVVEVNAKLDGDVNLYSGVADLEGHKTISAKAIERDSGPFRRHKAIVKLFELGRKYKMEILAGKRTVSGAVFDADGDRFYRLDYDPFRDALIVLGGDETAFLQGKYLMERDPKRYRGAAYINTVESDLNAGKAAAELGFKFVLSPVGDKWILSRIASLIAGTRQLGISDVRRFEELEKGKAAMELDRIPFAVGSEETGHNITLGRLGGTPVFFGNGVKSALNTFAASQFLLAKKSPRARFAFLEKPFKPGFKQTLYVYYVKKPLFHKGSKIWNRVKRTLLDEGRKLGYDVKTLAFPEEPDMLYLALKPGRGRGRPRSSPAGIFVRNSGTENKIGINLRGARTDAAKLRAVGERAVRILLTSLKDEANHFYKLELEVLSQVAGKPRSEGEIDLNPAERTRLLNEMTKQDLIRLFPEGYRLSPRGKWYIESNPLPPGKSRQRERWIQHGDDADAIAETRFPLRRRRRDDGKKP